MSALVDTPRGLEGRPSQSLTPAQASALLEASESSRLRDYQVSFLPVEAPYDLPERGWQVERRFHRELLTLG